MADDQDLQRLHNGEIDLTYCDFRGANLSNLDLSGRDFSGALLDNVTAKNSNFSRSIFISTQVSQLDAEKSVFSGAVLHHVPAVQVNLRGTDLRNASFKHSVLHSIDFTGADIRGADFSNTNIKEGTKFGGAIHDEKTLFDGATAIRALSRQPQFQFYTYDKGKLHRIGDKKSAVQSNATASPIPTTMAPSTNDVGSATASSPKLATIAQKIGEQPDATRDMATALANALDEEIGRLRMAKPNEPDALRGHEEYVGFLQQVSQGLHSIAEAIEAARNDPNPISSNEKFSRASEIVSGLRSGVEGWLTENTNMVVNYGFQVSLLGAGCMFLTLCGAPALPAFIASALLLSGKKLADGIDALRKPDK